jgi:hypothetical protein
MRKINLARGLKAETLVPALIALGVLLVITGVFQPWFSVRTSPELQLMTNSTMSMDVSLFQTVTVTRTDGNLTNGVTFALGNDTAYSSDIFQTMSGTRTDVNATKRSPDVNVTDTVDTTVELNVTHIGAYQGKITQTDTKVTEAANPTGTFTTDTHFNSEVEASMDQRSEMTSTFVIAASLTVAGLALSVLALGLALISGKTRMVAERFSYVLGVLGALLLLMAPLLMALGVTNFWGSLSIASGAFLWEKEAIVTWGPSIGWYLTFAASLTLFACSLLIRTAYLDKKRILAVQSLK